MNIMEKIYIETTIPSYYTAKPQKDPLKHKRQIITKKFWNYVTVFFDLYISPAVIVEVDRGDREAANIRKEAIADFKMLDLTPKVVELTNVYIKLLDLPEDAHTDAVHIAMACAHKMDFLITWNCNHIANAQNFKKIQDYNHKHKIHTPILTTPELFMGEGTSND